MTSDFTPKMNRLGVKRTRKVEGIFVQSRFSITSVFEMIKQLFWHHRVYLVKTHRKMYTLTLKGQGHVVTQVGHIAYESMH